MSQCEVLEKDRSRAVEQRTTKAFGTTDDVDQPSLVERLQHAAHGDATNLFDLGAADRLAIGNDGERLQRGAGQSRRSRRELCALDSLRVFRARENLPTSAD